ncbi:MAG: TIGR01906 family membrane protein [Defluviitaleaceae bacterium]|nr:TIGR01906 family membrane protein [Defluviitaleaceae bacterium]
MTATANKIFIKHFIKQYLIGLFIFISLVSLTAIITLNLTFTYPWMSRAFNLDQATGFDHATLLYNYRRIIHYLNWPWVTTLYMPDFPMSPTGEFHFWEVMIIFQVLQVISVLLITWLVISIRNKLQLLNHFNTAANLTFLIFGIFLWIMLIDFDFFFYWFHRAFFNNDYWIFNPRYDPIILALPAELFMIKGFIITGFLFLISVIVKIMFYRHQKNV